MVDEDLVQRALEHILPRLNHYDPSSRHNPKDPGIHPDDPDPEKSAANDILPFFRSLGISTIGSKEMTEKNVIFTTGITGAYTDILDILAERIHRSSSHRSKKPIFIMPVPSYFHYINNPKESGFEVVFLKREADGSIDPEKLDQCITQIAKTHDSFVACYYDSNPCAPMGHIRDVIETQVLARIFRNYPEIFLIDDFVDFGLEYSHKTPQTFLAYPELSQRAALLMGVSKSLGLPKLRAGVALVPEDIAYAMTNKISKRMDIPNGLSIEIIRLAFTDPDHFKAFTAQANAGNAFSRKIMRALLSGFEGAHLTKPNEKEIISAIVTRYLNDDAKRANEWLQNGIEGVKIVIEPEAGIFYLLDFSSWKGKYMSSPDGRSAKMIEKEEDIDSLLLQCGLKCMIGSETGGFEPEEMRMRVTFSHSPETIVGAMQRLQQARTMVYDIPQEAITACKRYKTHAC